MRKIGNILLIGICIILMIGCDEEHTMEDVEVRGTLTMATTISTSDAGLLDYLAPLFFQDSGWVLEYIATGVGEALEIGRNGEVDIIFVHDPPSEIVFVAEGFGVSRVPVMYNSYVLIGPAHPIPYGYDINAAFTRIYEEQLPFVSTGEDLGVKRRENNIWASLDLNPLNNANYIIASGGLDAAIALAKQTHSYCLANRSTWLVLQNNDTETSLRIIVEGDNALFNQYGLVAINPELHSGVNIEAANDFINWITSEEVQTLIARFGVEEFGEPLFLPNADTE